MKKAKKYVALYMMKWVGLMTNYIHCAMEITSQLTLN